MSTRKSTLYCLGLIAFSVIFWVVLDGFGALNGLREETLRWRYLARGERVTEDRVVYVNLDADTVSYMGDRPWDRAEFARLAAALLGPGGARTVALDIVFSEFSGASLLDTERARRGNRRLGSVVARYPDRLILAAAYTGTYSAIAEEKAAGFMIRDGYHDPETVPFPEAPSFPIIKDGVGRLGLANVDEGLNTGMIPQWVPAFVDIEGPRYGLQLMKGAMWHFLPIMEAPEIGTDGERFVLRDREGGWAPVSAPRHSRQRIPALGLAVLLADAGLGGEALKRTPEALEIRRADSVWRRLPLADRQSVEVNWLEGWRPGGATPHYSMRTLLERADALARAEAEGDGERVAALERWFARFRDAVVFVGPTDPMLKDLAPTPFNRRAVPKVTVHANLYRTIRENAFIHRPPGGFAPVAAAGLAFAVAGMTAYGGRRLLWARLGAAALLAAYVATVFVAFARAGWVVPLVLPLGATLTAVLLVLALKLGVAEWQRRRIKNLFGSYVSPELVERMVNSGEEPRLGGTEAPVSALFSDVVGFSALSEALPPGELVALMNEYLGAMTEVIQAERGTLDKYIGDAIVAMCGMPVAQEDQSLRACRAAVRMQERHAELREAWRRSGRWPEAVSAMRTRIGVHTGRAVVGNMGSKQRFDYTMIGDSVNLAARCESGAKRYGVYTMVTGDSLEAARRAGGEFRARLLDRIVVKGKTEPATLFELWDGSVPPDRADACKGPYESGLRHYFAGEWRAALRYFETSGPLEPFLGTAPTTPSEVLAARCRRFLREGAPPNWNGVYHMSEK